MSNETYINHPSFGLLFKLCQVEDSQELFTTLYAQRLFFLVTITNRDISFEPVSRSDARMIMEKLLRQLRRPDSLSAYQHLNTIYKRTFQ